MENTKNFELKFCQEFDRLPGEIECPDCEAVFDKGELVDSLPIGQVTGLTNALYCPCCNVYLIKYLK